MALRQPTDTAGLAARFGEPDRRYGPVPIWWWSGAPLRNDRLRWQMEQLLAGGVSQAVIMCLAPRGPLYGSLADDPAFLSERWWEIFIQACQDADELGFRFWLYDQYGFSGANVQGQLVAAHPEWAGQELVRTERVVAAGESLCLAFPAAGSEPLAAYFVADGQTAPESLPIGLDATVTISPGRAGRLCLCHAQTRGFDYYDHDACAALLDFVLGEFRRRADKWFGPVITGLFQDELPHMPTWGKGFQESFAAAYGYDLRTRIADLWEGGDDEAAGVRRDYHALRASLARESFFEPYGAWAASAGLITGFDQQTPAREGDPAGSTRLYGDYLSTHAVYSAPGSDHWGDSKVHSSLAHANGHPRTWIEAFHSSGWGGTLEETYDWLGPFLRRGANLYDPHAVYYSTAGGWWEWAPPSTCWRQPYWPDYRIFSDAVTRLCSLTAAGHLVADTVLVFPTSSVQADLPVSGGDDAARRTSDVYHRLNGATSWLDQRPGVLDRAHHDYEIFDERTLRSGTVTAGTWRIGDGRFQNLVLPAVTALDGQVAAQIADFVASGGRVVVVGSLPERFTGREPEAGHALLAVASDIHVVATADEVPEHLRSGPVQVDTDTPYMLRRCGDAFVLLLVAHDARTGTQMPTVAGSGLADRLAGAFDWKAYWEGARREGYRFRPLGDRVAHVRVRGLPDHGAQRWDPRSGDRVALSTHAHGADMVEFDVPFVDGSIAVVVMSTNLPDPTRTDPAGSALVVDLDDGWELEARSTLDNRWGDFGDPADRGVLPIHVWQLEHRQSETAEPPLAPDGWQPVLATFGPYLRVAGPQASPGGIEGNDPQWRPYEMSLSRGIRKDPLHFENLGPKGTVPEEFLRWARVPPGGWVGFAAAVDLPEGRGRNLVIGAPGERQVILDGIAVAAEGTGYWTASTVPDSAGRHEFEVWLQAAERSGDEKSTDPAELRATFAVVTDLARFRRPEWLQPAGQPCPGRVRLTTRIMLPRIPDDARIQVGSEGPCSILVNGTEVGRQGAFEPYQAQRRPQVMPYDLVSVLQPGDNEITIQLDDLGHGVAALVDSIAFSDGGLGLLTDLRWSGTRDGSAVGVRLRREQWTDPRWVCLWPRAHPLCRASWLDPATAGDGVVLDLVPDAVGDGSRTEWLRFTVPAGATSIRVPAAALFSAWVDGRKIAHRAGRLAFDRPLAAGTEVFLGFTADRGHRGGGLLAGPLEVTVAPVRAALSDWRALGFASLAGEVSYRRRLSLGADDLDSTVVLDLGEVRGSAEVRLGGRRVASVVWSPYRVDLTGHLQRGGNNLEIIVRGTLAGYLDDSSPTPAIHRGQTRHGLFGPVRLLQYPTQGRGGPMREPATARPGPVEMSS